MPPVASLVSAIALFAATGASQHRGNLTNDAFLFDNVAGRLVQFGLPALHPLEFSRDGTELYALNQPGAHLGVLDPLTLSRTGDVSIGIGAVSVVARPGSREVWVVDAVDSSVSVVDVGLQSIVRTIRVGGEPYGLVCSRRRGTAPT
jgi:YVTN family beta-propeller protein